MTFPKWQIRYWSQLINQRKVFVTRTQQVGPMSNLASLPYRGSWIYSWARACKCFHKRLRWQGRSIRKTSPVFFPSFSIFLARCIFLSLSTIQIYEYFCLYKKFFFTCCIFSYMFNAWHSYKIQRWILYIIALVLCIFCSIYPKGYADTYLPKDLFHR